MKGSFSRRALASCWRVSLLLLLGLSLLGGWLYWQSPSLDTIRPGIESQLKKKLQLKEIKLGKLSWSWYDFLWLKSDHLDFTSSDDAVAFHEGGIAVRIPLASLLSGNLLPDRIRLSGGVLDIAHSDSDGAELPRMQLVLDDVQTNWRYNDDWHGSLSHLQLMYDGEEKLLQVATSDFTISASLSEDLLPQEIKVQCDNLQWLPAPLQGYFNGSSAASLNLSRTGRRGWELNASAASDQPLILLPDTIYSVALNSAELRLKLKARQDTAFAVEHISLEKVSWALAESSIEAKGSWSAGLLTMQATSERLSMPVVWSWLRPLGDETWHHWLASMKSGLATQANAKLSLAWEEPFKSLPSAENWQAMLYQVSAQVEETDIALGISEDFLSDTTAQVDLNQNGLNAVIADAELPKGLGRSAGELYIPWQTLELHISGRSHVDVSALLGWFGPAEISGWQWNGAKAESAFQLVWDPSEPEPREATAELQPVSDWNVLINGTKIALSAGKANWDQESGLSIAGMHFRNQHIEGTLSLATSIGKEERWNITELEMSSKSDFAMLAAHFQLPLAQAGGLIYSNLKYDGKWRGSADLKEASWKQLLGSDKKTGEPYSIHCSGELDLQANTPTINLTSLTSQGTGLLIRGSSASINRERLKLSLNDLHTPSFSGSLKIHMPFGDAPWQLSVDADYLNRNALPPSLDYNEQMVDKPWLLSANLRKFDWDDSRMQGVFIKLASAKGSVGLFSAKQVHTTQLDITDIDSRFSLPGGGLVDLRHLSASIEKQRLAMSGTLKPEKDGGMRWQGFAELHGDFAHLLRRGRLSERFMGGDVHLLFSGSGIILREQPWWQGLDGRLRLRADKGRILEGGSLTTLLAATNLSKLPMLLLGQREDLTGPGIMYERLQMEAIMQNQNIHVRNVAMRSTAFDLAGHGEMNLESTSVDLYLVLQPLQNLDALLAKIPLLRDILGGSSHSLFRKVYRMHGPFTNAKVEQVNPEQAGLASAGLIEGLLTLPSLWFSSGKSKTGSEEPATAQQ
ncbi:AsmA-like C-terminal region [Mariprofundus ferrinatatus]|uniref:AsmA-like C-terminal region n=1 Tax=Mariprofundus ferrinatatus TaxID=1921087 RepID=A0A2K8L6A1_9PROT|nr:AsmA-like C-terminal domain-containing protein [Mariprofundus ferrinatatus]ATX82817.1 AsmA-like C-terminal region [Mariprofundus ferrinatatus]